MIKETSNRPLGAFEKAFWLLDYTNPASFAVAMELDEIIPVEAWKSALAKVQNRHPNLSVAIPSGVNKRLEFQHFPGNPIPLHTVKATADFRWETEIENEMALPFDTSNAPLLRAILIQKPEETVFVLIAHHAIADGKAITFVLRDLLLILAGNELEELKFQGSTDDMLGFPQADEKESGFKETWQKIANKDNNTEIFSTRTVPRLERRQFTAALTRQIGERAREEKTTFHGALCAAAILTSRELCAELKLKKLVLVTPVDERKILAVQEDCTLSISTKAVVFDPALETDFWSLARLAKQELAGSDTEAYTKGYIEFFRQITFTDLELPGMLDAMNTVFIQDIMVTNLGLMDSVFEGLVFKPKSLWGPIVISGTDNVQTIGAATINGRLCLTNLSRAPLPKLLRQMELKLTNACINELQLK